MQTWRGMCCARKGDEAVGRPWCRSIAHWTSGVGCGYWSCRKCELGGLGPSLGGSQLGHKVQRRHTATLGSTLTTVLRYPMCAEHQLKLVRSLQM